MRSASTTTSRRIIKTLLNSKEGIILCTGPTGSGKTTTLYSCIRTIEGEGVNIVTVEDPVEYRLGKNIVQVQTNEKTGLTFAAALRSILRQDPDIVLVGEIRDIETAQVAVQASLTGHLVLSTLHTNDAPNTVTRLVDMGLEAFKIGAALRGVIAQRLMRRICPTCRAKQPVSELPERLRPWIPDGATLWKAVGCGQCTQTGYRGRFSVVEILVMNPEMERLVGNNANADEIGKAARAGRNADAVRVRPGAPAGRPHLGGRTAAGHRRAAARRRRCHQGQGQAEGQVQRPCEHDCVERRGGAGGRHRRDR